MSGVSDGRYHIPSIAELEAMASKALASLSETDRNTVMDDLNALKHPDQTNIDECTLNDQLLATEAWLAVNKHENDAYQQAERISRSFVEQKELRTSFLLTSRCYGNRSSRAFREAEASHAAKRLMEYLEFKRELFGDARLTKDPLTFDDLTNDDIQCLQSGYWQVLGQDVAQRTIVAIFPALIPHYRTPNNFLRALFYFFLSLFPSPHRTRLPLMLLPNQHKTTAV